MRNSYITLQIKIFFLILSKKKLTFKKIFNAIACFWAYLQKSPCSAKSPMMISFELDNHCNALCLCCRNEKGALHDSNPKGTGIPIGTMSFEIYAQVIRQISDYALIAILYTNGEPLLYRKIINAVRLATKHNLATIISTNGQLLDEKMAKSLLESEIDIIKIALSGFSQQTYSQEVRHGDIEIIKKNIKTLARLKKEKNHRAILMIDFMTYRFNHHEIPEVIQFCKNLKILLNFRPGNPRGGLEKTESPLKSGQLPLDLSCDWIWKGLQIDFDGAVLPCCEYPLWSGCPTYGHFDPKKTNLLDLWNGAEAQKMRLALAKNGRKSFDICAACARRGIAFKW